MRLTRGGWTLILVVVGIVGVVVAVQVRGFHMWDLPFVIFGCAIFIYAIFGWHSS